MTDAQPNHPLHSMCTYLGSYPPRVPRELIKRWVAPRTRVLDPFCGSGSTMIEAKLLRHESYGIDNNPLAIAISKAKTTRVDLSDVLHRLSDLAMNFKNTEIDDAPDDLRVIFHERTLSQLCYLRGELRLEEPEDRFLIGALLGIMHGKRRKSGGTAYLSIDMPNTFSMSPNYVRKFIKENNLKQTPVDVFSKLGERSRWLLRKGSLPERPKSVIVQGDATQLHHVLPSVGIRRVGAIVTSPPYLGILRYGAFNWIRLWFLRFNQYEIDRSLDTTDSLDRYLSFMASFFYSAKRVLSRDGTLVLVIGDVVENGQHVPLATRLWEELTDVVPFDFVHEGVDEYNTCTKTTRIWGKEKKGRATPVDRVLVLRAKRKMARSPARLKGRESSLTLPP